MVRDMSALSSLRQARSACAMAQAIAVERSGFGNNHRLQVSLENDGAATALTAQAGLNDDLVWSGRLLPRARGPAPERYTE